MKKPESLQQASPRYRAGGIQAVALALGFVSVCAGCDAAKNAPAETDSELAAAATSAEPKASASMKARTKPSDPVLAELVGEPPADAGLDKKESLAALGLSWSVPKTWKTMDFSDATGGAAKVRKKSHSLDNATSIDISVMSDFQVKDFAGGKPFPEVGDEPYKGRGAKDGWTPFAEVTFGRSDLKAIATHGKIKKIRLLYLVFKSPKGGKVVQASINWKVGDADGQKLASAVARSFGVE